MHAYSTYYLWYAFYPSNILKQKGDVWHLNVTAVAWQA